jgi:hypothetical protein
MLRQLQVDWITSVYEEDEGRLEPFSRGRGSTKQNVDVLYFK